MGIANLSIGRLNFNKNYSNVIFLVVALLFSYFFMYLRFSMNIEFAPGSLSALTNYSAFKPFQYRIFMPWIAHQLYQLKFYPFNSVLTIFRILETTSIFLIVVSFRYYISLFIKDSRIDYLLAFSILYILPFNFLFPRILPIFYPYDMPSVFFFTLGLIFIYQRKWNMYYIVFIIATFNRETTCFLTVIYLFTSIKREKINGIIYHCCAQFIIWLIIKLLSHIHQLLQFLKHITYIKILLIHLTIVH